MLASASLLFISNLYCGKISSIFKIIEKRFIQIKCLFNAESMQNINLVVVMQH